MIVRKQTIRFSPDRVPNPKKIRIGYEGDHIVERLEFVLPTVNANQTGFLMKSGANADIAMLTRNEEGRMYVDLTALMIGAEGVVECYVRVDGAGKETWQSGIIRMIIGDVPGVEVEIEREYPTAVSQMLAEIAEHDAAMGQQRADIAGLAEAADTSATNAAQSAAWAWKAEGNVQDAKDAAEQAQSGAAASETAAKNSADAAAESANAAALSADRAEQGAAAQGYIFFEINDAGHLIMTRTENVTGVDFRLVNGRLEAVYG